MRITRVELTNIKSYEHAAIDLRSGVTAIRGHNGAGKSTLLEAIGWALFDYLPYKQEKFVREGQTSGKVVITFISPREEREYVVTRRGGSHAEWFINDPETGIRYDSKVDVLDFLKHQLRLEGSLKLDELFIAALGVPQGMLTSDFLETAANRKKKFDGLLQVEDYRAAADSLRETATYLKDQTQAQDVRIATLEESAAQLDGWRQEREGAHETRRDAAQRLDALARDLEQVEATLGQLLQAQTELARCDGVAQVAATAHSAAQQQLTQATSLRDESLAAMQTLAATADDHAAHQRAEAERAHAQRRTLERDSLLDEQRGASSALEHAKHDASAASARLSEIEQAERRIVALQAPVARQTALERQRDDARTEKARLTQIEGELTRQGKQRATLERAIAERKRELAQLETARPLAEALEERRVRVEALQSLAARREQHEKRRAAIARECEQVATNRASAAEKQTKQRENLRKLEGVRAAVEGLADREREQEAAEQAVREIEARLKDFRSSRDLSGAGNCPFLREPCKNIQQRGENNLAVYFDRLIAREEVALAPALAQRETASAQTAYARKAALYYAKLDGYRDQLDQATTQITECDARDAALAAELGEIARDLAAAGDLAGLDAARRHLRESQEADKRLATLPALLRGLAEQEEQFRELADEMGRRQAEQATLADAPARLEAALAELLQLGDKRAELLGQVALAEGRAEVERKQAEAEQRSAKAEAELARLDQSLAPYAALAAEIAALEAALTRARPGHNRYLQHERAAAQLDERQLAHQTATERETSAAREAQTAAAALTQAQARFDAQALADARARANELRASQGSERERQTQAEAALADLERKITLGEQRLAELERAHAERDELAEMLKMLEQFRSAIKEAGPLVTQHLLEQISAQANGIFGDIIGDHSARLAWKDDYEITLTRGAAARPFALLSGGEQMAAALAMRLALLRRLTGLDLAFFDEPTQNMDSERRSALAEQIRRVRGFDQLIVISHDDTFEQGLDSVIHLEKRDGVTVVSDADAEFIGATSFGVFAADPEDATPVERFADLSALLTD
jgi:DNA repair protein SbcC/Rad50